MNMLAQPTDRRSFLKTLTTASAGLAGGWPALAQTPSNDSPRKKIPLGFDNFSLRPLGWKAGQFLDYAAAQKLDVIFFSDLKVYAVTTGIRDTAVWETREGVQAQWAAIGEGNTDWPAYVRRFAELCPNTPFVLEIISQYGRPLPYLKDDFWKPYPKVRAREFARFLAFAKRGQPKAPFTVPAGRDRGEYEKEFAKAELERSLRYCRDVLGLGVNS